MSSALFKRCTMCTKPWTTRDDFLKDKTLKLNGYGADFQHLGNGLFYFTHEVEECCSTVVIEAKDFFDLYTGEKFDQRRTGKEDCPGYCLDQEQLSRCDAICECAMVREVIQKVLEHNPLTDHQFVITK